MKATLKKNKIQQIHKLTLLVHIISEVLFAMKITKVNFIAHKEIEFTQSLQSLTFSVF